MSPVSQPDQITAPAVARILGTSIGTVKRHAKDGTIPYLFKLDGSTGAYVFDRATIVAIAEADLAERANAIAAAS